MNAPVDVIQKPRLSLSDFDRSRGTDEMNLCEFPLASLSTRTEPGQTTLKFEDSVHDSGTNSLVQRTLMVTGSEHFGLPTATDNDILLVLMHLSNVRNRFRDKRVEFTRYELIKFLGWPPDGRAYKRLDESLMRWTTVSLHYKHAWWDRSGRRWKNRSFHVIGSLELRGHDDFRDDGRSCFTWDEVIFQSFQSGNLKRIDLNVYFNLKLAVSRQMYRFLDKRFWHKSQLEFDLRQFATEHIGLSRCYDVHEIKRKLKPAIRELQATGFLAEVPFEATFRRTQPGKWQIFVRKAPTESDRKPPNSRWESVLTSQGISRSIARKLAEEFSSEHLAEKIEIHDKLVGNQDPRIRRNPAGFLAASIRDDYRTPAVASKISLAPQRNARQTKELKPNSGPPGSNAIAKTQTEETVQFDNFWQGLSSPGQDEFERRAIETSSTFHRATLSRLKSSDHSLSSVLCDQLIRQYWKKLTKLRTEDD